MATAASICLTKSLAFLIVAGNMLVVSAFCRENAPALIQRCSKFVQKGGSQITPSSECCGVVKSVGVECLCALLTDSIAKQMDTNKAVFVARTCGLTLQPGRKCGGINILS
ncbi:hypothetical protein L6164_030004 [Bauhinia variegata]|uniref:Uncharacterized protein n=1 Tax=Bauhinia variegata TaxID=167791 RepID=A0ACB9LAU1_BAUVA|nr:hypothetical protein L6164_030004 [Bauhinia variegata]